MSDCTIVPGNIPCAVCGDGKSSYSSWNFERGKKAICDDCANGHYFDPVGNVIERQQQRVVGLRVQV